MVLSINTYSLNSCVLLYVLTLEFNQTEQRISQNPSCSFIQTSQSLLTTEVVSF